MGLNAISGRIVAIGEVMLELSGPDSEAKRLAWAGDTANTAVYLARMGVQTSYLTALGLDPYSDTIKSGLEAEGVDTRFVLRHPDRLPGLYAISTTATGERTFHYWRSQSAARDFFNLDGASPALASAASTSLLYLTGITLSIFSAEERARLVKLAATVRANGGHVAFDPNYRARGWNSPSEARTAIDSLAPHISMVLPSREDEDELFGVATTEQHIERWQTAGVDEIVLKCGAGGVFVVEDTGRMQHVPVEKLAPVIDTTGAGDSFNAAYIAARLAGASRTGGAVAGNRLASIVVGHRGSLIPRNVMREFDKFVPRSL
ncbi:sugar kinase [Henriciella sp.]|uniref:sugar kinase n=1 Tax=Henriciella sp. TaxID=1968823 RepID=UPI002615B644|nr:sugar kinase [Henriciella sp.]